MPYYPANRRQARRGAVTVESAVSYSVLLVLIFGLIIGGFGVFRYHQIASLAHEAARYAAVRGQQYAYEVKDAKATTADDIYKNVIEKKAVSLDLSKLKHQVSWDQTNASVRVTNDGKVVANSVTVTITYTWVPELIFPSPITMTSSATMPMYY